MYSYHCNCVAWPNGDVNSPGGLSDMVDQAICISRRTFLKHVDRKELLKLSKSLGYESNPAYGLTMAGDWHITYYRSKLHGKRVYYFVWSGIEYVFTESDS